MWHAPTDFTVAHFPHGRKRERNLMQNERLGQLLQRIWLIRHTTVHRDIKITLCTLLSYAAMREQFDPDIWSVQKSVPDLCRVTGHDDKTLRAILKQMDGLPFFRRVSAPGMSPMFYLVVSDIPQAGLEDIWLDPAQTTCGRQPLPAKVRFDVLKKFEFTCVYCGRRPPEIVLEVDHIRAVANGGGDDPENLTAACRECNGGKGASPLEAP